MCTAKTSVMVITNGFLAYAIKPSGVLVSHGSSSRASPVSGNGKRRATHRIHIRNSYGSQCNFTDLTILSFPLIGDSTPHILGML
jgi:hypothetical protein